MAAGTGLAAPPALKWLGFDAGHKLQADRSALHYFTSANVSKKRTFLISIIGPARKGKSALMCELQKRAAASQGIAYTSTSFTVLSSATPVTQGVEICPVGFGPTKDSLLLLADTEGQGDQSAEVDSRVFVPVLLTSGVVIFNTVTAGGSSRSQILTELRNFVAAAGRVDNHRTRAAAAAAAAGAAGAASTAHSAALASAAPVGGGGGGGGGGGTGEAAFGHLHIVVRDYALDNWDPAWHYDAIFNSRDGTSADEAATQTAVKEAFASITIHLLPHFRYPYEPEGGVVIGKPVTFAQGVDRLWALAWKQTCDAEKANATIAAALTGYRMASLTNELLPVLNADGVVVIASVFQSIIRAECLELVQATATRLMDLSWSDEATALVAAAAEGTLAPGTTLLSVLLKRFERENALLDPLYDRVHRLRPQRAVYDEIERQYTAAVRQTTASLLAALRIQFEARIYDVTNASTSTLAAECTDVKGPDIEARLAEITKAVQDPWARDMAALKALAVAMTPSRAGAAAAPAGAAADGAAATPSKPEGGEIDTKTDECVKSALATMAATEAPLLSEAACNACATFWSDMVTTATAAALTKTAAAASRLLQAEVAAASARIAATTRAALPGVCTNDQASAAVSKLLITIDAMAADLQCRGELAGATAEDVATAVAMFESEAHIAVSGFSGLCDSQIATATVLAEARAAKEAAEVAAAHSYQQLRELTDLISASNPAPVAPAPAAAHVPAADFLEALPHDLPAEDYSGWHDIAFRPPPDTPAAGLTLDDYRGLRTKLGWPDARTREWRELAAESPAIAEAISAQKAAMVPAPGYGTDSSSVPHLAALAALQGPVASLPALRGGPHTPMGFGLPALRGGPQHTPGTLDRRYVAAGSGARDFVYASGGSAAPSARVGGGGAVAPGLDYSTPLSHYSAATPTTSAVVPSFSPRMDHLKRDGTLDMRYADNIAAVRAGIASPHMPYTSVAALPTYSSHETVTSLGSVESAATTAPLGWHSAAAEASHEHAATHALSLRESTSPTASGGYWSPLTYGADSPSASTPGGLGALPGGVDRMDGSPDVRYAAGPRHAYPDGGLGIAGGPGAAARFHEREAMASPYDGGVAHWYAADAAAAAAAAAASPSAAPVHLKRDGTPDMRYTVYRAAAAADSYGSDVRYSTPPAGRVREPDADVPSAYPPPHGNRATIWRAAAASPSAAPPYPILHLKKDGTPDMRYSDSMAAAAAAAAYRSDGARPSAHYYDSPAPPAPPRYTSPGTYGSPSYVPAGPPTYASWHPSSGSAASYATAPGPIKKDGTPDMRFRSNREAFMKRGSPHDS